MEKRGQVAMFIILGIVILAVIGVTIYLLSSKTQTSKSAITATETELDNMIREVNSLVQGCVNKIGKEVIIDTAVYGGYPIRNRPEFDSRPGDILFAPYAGGGATPRSNCGMSTLIFPDFGGTGCSLTNLPACSLSSYRNFIRNDMVVMSVDMSNYINHFIDSTCLKGFRSIENKGWKVDLPFEPNVGIVYPSKDYSTDVKLTEGLTEITFQIPRKFTKGDKSFEIDKFHYEHGTDFQEISGMIPDFLARLTASAGDKFKTKPEREIEYGKFENEVLTPEDYAFLVTDPDAFTGLFSLYAFKKNGVEFRFAFFTKEPNATTIAGIATQIQPFLDHTC